MRCRCHKSATGEKLRKNQKWKTWGRVDHYQWCLLNLPWRDPWFSSIPIGVFTITIYHAAHWRFTSRWWVLNLRSLRKWEVENKSSARHSKTEERMHEKGRPCTNITRKRIYGDIYGGVLESAPITLLYLEGAPIEVAISQLKPVTFCYLLWPRIVFIYNFYMYPGTNYFFEKRKVGSIEARYHNQRIIQWVMNGKSAKKSEKKIS